MESSGPKKGLLLSFLPRLKNFTDKYMDFFPIEPTGTSLSVAFHGLDNGYMKRLGVGKIKKFILYLQG